MRLPAKDGSGKNQAKLDSGTKRRMTYHPPRLTDYGDFRRLTGGRTGFSRNDGHVVKTKNTA
jgi:hypothetical protein